MTDRLFDDKGKPDERPLFKRSLEVQLLVEFLSELEIGQSITYIACAEKCGSSVTNVKPHIGSARKILQREEQKVIECERGVGVFRADDKTIAGGLQDKQKRIGRMAKSGRKLSTCIKDMDGLGMDLKTMVLGKQSYFAVVELSSRQAKQKAIEDRVRPVQKKLGYAEILDALKNGME